MSNCGRLEVVRLVQADGPNDAVLAVCKRLRREHNKVFPAQDIHRFIAEFHVET